VIPRPRSLDRARAHPPPITFTSVGLQTFLVANPQFLDGQSVAHDAATWQVESADHAGLRLSSSDGAVTARADLVAVVEANLPLEVTNKVLRARRHSRDEASDVRRSPGWSEKGHLDDRDQPVAFEDVEDDLPGTARTDGGDAETCRVGRYERASDRPGGDLERGPELGERCEKLWR
jgi:hypothetical protein